jgi:hypothetical protein
MASSPQGAISPLLHPQKGAYRTILEAHRLLTNSAMSIQQSSWQDDEITKTTLERAVRSYTRSHMQGIVL